jgi:hypothetical protein
MAIDTMRRLSAFRPVAEYRYVGLGGFEFIDFDLIKRSLGIRSMISIEETNHPARSEFNCPSPDIEVLFGHSNVVLPGIAIDEPSIIWMDYCSPLRHDVLQDILLLGERMLPGSMLLITANAAVSPDGERVSTLEERVGRDRVPLDVSEEKHLDGHRTAAVQRRILLSEIRKGLSKREDGVRFEQVMNVNYRDTTAMQTIGGIFVDTSTTSQFASAEFRTLEQVKTTEEPLKVRVPVLTAREVLDLEKRMQRGEPFPTFDWLKSRERDSFGKLHRWYPPVPAPM